MISSLNFLQSRDWRQRRCCCRYLCSQHPHNRNPDNTGRGQIPPIRTLAKIWTFLKRKLVKHPIGVWINFLSGYQTRFWDLALSAESEMIRISIHGRSCSHRLRFNRPSSSEWFWPSSSRVVIHSTPYVDVHLIALGHQSIISAFDSFHIA